MRFLIVLCLFFLLGGCGGKAVSSPDALQHLEEKREHDVDPKLAHRFEQRGFSEEMLTGTDVAEEENIETEEETLNFSASIETMASNSDWVKTELVLQEDTFFNEQTVQYFIEDVYENYPPVKKETLDAIATLIYEDESTFILDGILRNGFTKRTFSKKQLQPLVFKLVTDNHHEWIVTKLTTMEGISEIKSGEARPFRLIIPKEHVRIRDFDYRQFGYHAVIQQPK